MRFFEFFKTRCGAARKGLRTVVAGLAIVAAATTVQSSDLPAFKALSDTFGAVTASAEDGLTNSTPNHGGDYTTKTFASTVAGHFADQFTGNVPVKQGSIYDPSNTIATNGKTGKEKLQEWLQSRINEWCRTADLENRSITALLVTKSPVAATSATSGTTNGTYAVTVNFQQNSEWYISTAKEDDAAAANYIIAVPWKTEPKPIITTQPPTTKNVDMNSTLSISVTAAPDTTATYNLFGYTLAKPGKIHYQWYKKNASGTFVALTGKTENTYTTTAGDATEGEYRAEVWAENEYTNALSAHVTTGVTRVLVSAPPVPVITVQPTVTPASVSIGESFTLSVTATSPDNGQLQYQWYKVDRANGLQGVAVSDVNTITRVHIVDNATPADAGSYYVKVRNGSTNSTQKSEWVTSSNTAYANVAVGELTLPVIVTQPAAFRGVALNAPAELSVAATGDGEVSYRWLSSSSEDGPFTPVLGSSEPIAGDTSGKTPGAVSGNTTAASANFKPVTNTLGTTYYRVEVTNTKDNASARVYSNISKVIVGEATADAEMPDIKTPPEYSVTAKEGEKTNLHVDAVSTDGGTLSYQWYIAWNTSWNADRSLVLYDWEPATYEWLGQQYESKDAWCTVDPIAAGGTTYLYVKVTNTKGTSTAEWTSDVITLKTESWGDSLPPAITTQPVDVVASTNAKVTLSVVANSPDNYNLSYQWYKETRVVNADDTIEIRYAPIEGAMSASYETTANASSAGNYYVVVTNRHPYFDPAPKSIQSNTVNGTVGTAQRPVITEQPKTQDVKVGQPAALSVTATSPDNGELTYIWFIDRNLDGHFTEVPESFVNENTCTVPTTTAGTYSYRVEVTNRSPDGFNVARTCSNAATVVVSDPDADAQAPKITGPQPATAVAGEPATIFVTATVNDGGTLSYQWYSNTENSNTGGTLVEGATSAVYSAPTTAEGSYYYYVVVTNTKVTSGKKTATKTSAPVTVTVEAPPPPVEPPPVIETPVPVAEYTVTFNSDGGTEIPAVTVEEGSIITEPKDPVKDGYTFEGWYKDEALTTEWKFAPAAPTDNADNTDKVVLRTLSIAGDIVTGNTTLHAKWTPVPKTTTPAPTTSGGRTSSGGSSGGGSGRNPANSTGLLPATPKAAPAATAAAVKTKTDNVDKNGNVSSAKVLEQLKKLKAAKGSKPVITISGAKYISKSALEKIAALSKQLGIKPRLKFNTYGADGKLALVQSFDATALAAKGKGVKIGGSLSSDTHAAFAKLLGVPVMVIGQNQADSFGAKGEIIIKPEPGFDVSNLSFLSGNLTTKKFTKFKATSKLDSKGFLHIVTNQGGFIFLLGQ